MKIILDTHIFLWVLSNPDKLSEKRKELISSRANQIFVSSISITEIMIKSSIGKLEIHFDPVEYAEKSGFDLLDFSATDALPLKELPFHHKDPFDRMLISQGINRNFNICTDDPLFKQYHCQLI